MRREAAALVLFLPTAVASCTKEGTKAGKGEKRDPCLAGASDGQPERRDAIGEGRLRERQEALESSSEWNSFLAAWREDGTNRARWNAAHRLSSLVWEQLITKAEFDLIVRATERYTGHYLFPKSIQWEDSVFYPGGFWSPVVGIRPMSRDAFRRWCKERTQEHARTFLRRLHHDLPYVERVAEQGNHISWTAKFIVAPIRKRLAEVQEVFGPVVDKNDEVCRIMERARTAMAGFEKAVVIGESLKDDGFVPPWDATDFSEDFPREAVGART